jgi:hypothetical protein
VIIYLDESGDLGFDFSKAKTTSTFIITLLVCDGAESAKIFGRAVRRTLKNKLNFKKNSDRELKGAFTSLPVKNYFFRHLSPDGWQLHTLIFDKKKAVQIIKNQPDKNRIYNVLSRHVIRSIDFSNADSVTLINDRCKSSSEIKVFNEYIQNQLEATLPLNVPLNIHHNLSHDEAGLQAVDLFCWGIFRKYELNDSEWYEVFDSKIQFEEEYDEKAGQRK